jgi:hypothetical protein
MLAHHGKIERRLERETNPEYDCDSRKYGQNQNWTRRQR